MQRIVIIGSTGSGKSTLAKRLAEKRGLRKIDLDEFHWLPGWQERPRADFLASVREATRADTWIVAGNYTSRGAQDIIWPRADTLIWLDMPFWPNFWQLFVRTLDRWHKREAFCNGNYETLAKGFFSRDSILLWFLKTWAKNREKYGTVFARARDYPHLDMIRLRSYAESAQFIEDFKGKA